MYVDYDYYQNTYLGSMIPSESFGELESRAKEVLLSNIIVTITDIYSDYPSIIPDEMKRCICSLAEIIYSANNKINANLSSEKIGRFSQTFQTEQNPMNTQERMQLSIKTYLGLTGLLYKGL